VQLASVAVALRPRSAWESTDLGVCMLQRWWRTLYAASAAVFLPVAGVSLALGLAAGKAWIAVAALWWLKPALDRVALHVVSRAVFGEALDVRGTLAQARTWLASGLPWALTFGRLDLARSFHLPVRQLEGQRGRAYRARRALLGRRAHGYAVWLTSVCLLFTLVLVWSFDMFGQLLLPAKAQAGSSIGEVLFAGAEVGSVFTYVDFGVVALAVFVIEPLYVAVGFALYLNRRTLLEGWDLEVALRRMAERRAPRAGGAALALLVAALLGLAPAPPAFAQDKAGDPHAVIAEVLKAPEFPHERTVLRWQRRAPELPEVKLEGGGFDLGWLRAIGYAFAKSSEAALWIAAVALIAFGVWWAARTLPRQAGAPRAAYRAPATLFGMALAPDTLPADLAGAVRALLAAGRLRVALALLYRGTLSALVHARGVPLLASDTVGEVLARVRARADKDTTRYVAELVALWQRAAYARRAPAAAEVERLAAEHAARFAREAAA
jgi:hypothetical protein